MLEKSARRISPNCQRPSFMKRTILLKMITAGSILGCIVIFVFSHFSAQSLSRYSVPLKDRIAEADLVIVAQLKDVQAKYYTVKWRKTGELYAYDIGRLVIEKTLKGSWSNGGITIEFNHP